MTKCIHTIQNYIYMYYYNINTLKYINKCNTIKYMYDLSFKNKYTKSVFDKY